MDSSKRRPWIRKPQGAPLTQIRGLEVPGMEFWEHPPLAGRTPHADPWPRSARNGVLGASAIVCYLVGAPHFPAPKMARAAPPGGTRGPGDGPATAG